MPTSKIFCFILLTGLSYASCKNTDSDNNKHNGQINVSKSPWYKRYTGTIGGEPVVVNLRYCDKTIHGSYYYTDKGIIIDLLPARQNAMEMDNISFAENNPEERSAEDDSSGKNYWQLDIQNTTAKGKRASGDGKKVADIALKEEYPAHSYALDALEKGNSREERKGVVRIPAVTLYDLVVPPNQMNREQADFLSGAIIHFLGGEFADAKSIDDYVYREDKKYFEDFERLLGDMKIDREAHEDWEYSFEHIRHMDVIYNDNGMLVLRLVESDHTGGGIKGSHTRSRYACIDMDQKKLLQLKDIIDMDAGRLSPLLDEEARKVFNIPKGALSEKLRVGSIPMTDNIYITGTGISFCYYPGVIMPEDDGETSLFLPYTKIRTLLTEKIMKRVHL